MKIKQTNAEGVEEEIEVSTEAEVAAKIEAEKKVLEDKHTKELEETKGKITTFENEKKDLQKKIDDMVASGMNADNPSFKVLKEALDKKDEAIKEIKDGIENDKKTRAAEDMDTKIKLASKGNEDLEKKIRHHLEKTLTGLPEGTKAERQTKLEAAYKLAADASSDGPGIFDGGTGNGGKGGGGEGGGEGGVEFSAKEKALGKKLGITDADYKKYGSRVSKRN